MCDQDGNGGLDKDEFARFANHKVIETYLFVIVDGANGGVGNNSLIPDEYKKLGLTVEKGI
jgi:hypothetical protein